MLDESERPSCSSGFWELIRRRAHATPDHTMLIDEHGGVLSFRELHDDALRVAAGLMELGVKPGSVVSWQLPTCIDAVLLSAALCRLGAVQNPIIHLYREREVGFALRQTGATHFVLRGQWRGRDFAAMARRASEEYGVAPQIVEVGDGLPRARPVALPPEPVYDDASEVEPRWIFYTSGTTGDPKGVRHTDRSLLAAALGLAVASETTPDDVGTIAFPIAHIGGPDALGMLLMTGSSAVLVEAFSASSSLELLREHGVTRLGGGPAFYLACLQEQRKDPHVPVLPKLRVMSGGGAPKPPELHYEVKRELGGRGVTHGYGMTEVPMISSGVASDTDEQLANTDGKPIAGAEIRVVRRDGTIAERGEDGEIRVRGPMVFSGYVDAGLDRDAFDDDGFFRTGDIGRVRPDGHLQLTGRLKDVIVRKGENISAQEVEGLLYEHPKVADVAVIGIPDRERGEMACAVVQDTEGLDALEFDEMVRFLAEEKGLMIQKIPERLWHRHQMPRNATGKISKLVLRKEYAKHATN